MGGERRGDPVGCAWIPPNTCTGMGELRADAGCGTHIMGGGGSHTEPLWVPPHEPCWCWWFVGGVYISVQYTLMYTLQCTVYINILMYTVHNTLMYTVHCTQHINVHCTLYSVQCTQHINGDTKHFTVNHLDQQ